MAGFHRVDYVISIIGIFGQKALPGNATVEASINAAPTVSDDSIIINL
jgi:hypothetical protein